MTESTGAVPTNLGMRLEVAAVLEEIRPAIQMDGGDVELVEIGANGVHVTELGRYFLRNVSMVFDAYLARGGEKPLFSRTV